MIEIIGWVGAATMVGASFKMTKPLGLKMAIVGLFILISRSFSGPSAVGYGGFKRLHRWPSYPDPRTK